MNKLKDLYQSHLGKVSQKWSIYLDEYEKKLKPYKELPIKFFEIGIENGGSLEIISKYFLNAELIIGCDINPKCANLEYEKSNIKVVVGDANNESIKNEIVQHSKFDIIIDDGSHSSIDTVKAFCNYFNYLKEDGLFIIEDMHCSYWEKWGGGILYPISSINFFKKLVDVINYEHWGVEKKSNWLLRGFSHNFKINLEKLKLDEIHSIEFVNSLCFIRKKSSKKNKLGNRVIAGKTAKIYPGVLNLDNKASKILDESKNSWSNKEFLPEEELLLCQKELENIKKEVLNLKQEIKDLKKTEH